MNRQIDSLLTRPRSTEVAAQTPRVSEQIHARRARYHRDEVIPTYWYLLYMFSLGLFGAIVILLGAEVW